jgi:polyhydroxybutyrate depolymerase
VAVDDALRRWIEANGCAPTPRTTAMRAGRFGAPDASHTATRLEWAPCRDGVEVVQWKLAGAGHGWPGHSGGLLERVVGPATTVVDAAAEAWAFASRFRRR